MTADVDGYISDVAYAAYAHRANAPAWLHFVATALGRRAPDPSQPYRWCELGCGPGFGAAMLAAANPHATFHGIDVSAEHIRQASLWRQAGALDNLELTQTAFAQHAAASPCNGEQYDYIVVTGVYAWLSPENQAALRAIVARDLRPGGVLHITYPCMPGMAPVVPLRQLFRALAARAEGGPAQQAASALAQLRAMGHAGAAYFDAFPALLAGLDDIVPEQLGDIAHDYLSTHWRALDVGEVLRDMAALGCEWIGSAQPADNIDAICLPPGTHELVGGLPATDLRESARAFCANQALRSDIFQRRGPDTTLSPEAHRAMLLAQRLYGWGGAQPEMSRPDPRAAQAIAAPAFARLRARLTGAALSFAQAARLLHETEQPGALNPTFQLLAGAGVALPVLSAPPDPSTAFAFNRAVARAVLQGGAFDTLAAPALGAGIRATLPQMAALLSQDADAPSGAAPAPWRVSRAWDTVRRHRATVHSPSQPPAAFVQALADFDSVIAPSWRQIGVMP